MLTRHETLKSLPSKSEYVNQDILKTAWKCLRSPALCWTAPIKAKKKKVKKAVFKHDLGTSWYNYLFKKYSEKN